MRHTTCTSFGRSKVFLLIFFFPFADIFICGLYTTCVFMHTFTENAWTLLGPGARKGISRIFPDTARGEKSGGRERRICCTYTFSFSVSLHMPVFSSYYICNSFNLSLSSCTHFFNYRGSKSFGCGEGAAAQAERAHRTAQPPLSCLARYCVRRESCVVMCCVVMCCDVL